MNTTRPRRHLMTLLGLDPTDQRSTTRIRFAVTTVAAFATAVQIIVWLLMGIFRTDLDGPWWLWTPGSALLINAALLSVDHVRDQWLRTGSSHRLQTGHLRTDDVTRESL
ncbi:hypothetical protein ABZ719_36720 [Streptomyces sp. NPDC006743]|uniref:hypothetical protein n=1 Tax=unclassified Streptomyces TaxID=2593676 RepID=UPI000B0D08AD|nr:hypothetical protein [Streptomyces sp. NRRL S-340]